MCSVILPIYSNHANNIYRGIKKYEYRRIAPSKKVDYLLLYETKPVCSITGIVKVVDILRQNPEKIWKMTRKYSGISHELYISYYRGRDYAVAYQLGEVTTFKKPISLSEINIDNVPQSFQYVDDKILNNFIA